MVQGRSVLFVFDQQHWAIAAEQLNGAEPVGEVGVFFAFVGDEGVEGAFGEEELMGLVVDLLAAKVPDDWSRNSWPSSRRKAPLNYLNAMGGVFVGVEFVVGVLNLFG
jgi:hypothetical protein